MLRCEHAPRVEKRGVAITQGLASEVYERDEKLLACGACGRQWTEPRVLIQRPDGSCEEG